MDFVLIVGALVCAKVATLIRVEYQSGVNGSPGVKLSPTFFKETEENIGDFDLIKEGLLCLV